MNKTSVNLDLAGKKLTFETGQLANQASASVLARLGDTMILATVVEGKLREDIDYFPLTVEYIERLYAGGRIKGSRWVKREGRPSDDAILTARLIDRSIRPLFPKEFKKEVQIIVTVLSVDGENEPDVLSIIAVSAALSISSIPWKGPIGSVRVGFVKEKDDGQGDFIINPGRAELELTELDLVASQTKEKTVMIEAGASQVSDDVVLTAVKKAHEENKAIIAFIEDFTAKAGQKKGEVKQDSVFNELVTRIEKSYKEEILSFIKSRAQKESSASTEFSDLSDRIFEGEKTENPEKPADKKNISKAIEYILFKGIREKILTKGERPDGRKIDEVRPISGMVSVLPRTHGSAIFQRGDTQALTVVTLGSPKLEQLIESAEGEESKRYMHHYSMPPYSVGETGRVGTPSRREIGHGALAERALVPVIPKQDKFPYTIRIVSEILSSNGSTSMASTCGSTLALMDAGVPIEKPVAGIAMGKMSKLKTDKEEYVILTDIIGLEDFSGDMDFKVAGTDTGITAIQLDVKTLGLTHQQIAETVEKAKTARMHILGKMQEVLSASRSQVSEFAPKIELVKIPVEKIGEVIGPGGRVIKNIIAQTGAAVDVEDDGTIAISGISEEAVTKAVDWIKGLTREVVAGETFEGEVKRILPFGAFVEILPGKEGMVHVSQMARGFVKNPTDVVSIGKKVQVKVIEIDEQGRINLTMLLDGIKEEPNRGNGPEQQPRTPERTAERNQTVHPLTMQFRRERFGNKTSSTRRSPSRPGGRFRPSR
ncbi:polyribonucleotide nucleotidyltransferase [Candidatus Microgenomates bacterium]|nr:MAG: polyribonucleotide nucleotidyltransferase [Candidatus Microgenomates bacterium]